MHAATSYQLLIAQHPAFARRLVGIGPGRVSCYYRQGNPLPARGLHLSQPQDLTGHPEQTMELLAMARKGDGDAMNRLFERLAPPLQRWARGRLPGWARGMVSTVDLVQEAMFSTFRVIERKRHADDFAIHAYLRQSLKNRLIDELRKVQRRPALEEMKHTRESEQASPLEEAIGGEALERFEAALEAIDPASRDAVLARIELGLPYADIAVLMGKPSADAARMAVSRALVQLAEAMDHG